MTLLDYPDKIAALIFTQGCNFYCGYCHNPEMIPTVRILPASSDLEPESIFEFLKTRVGLLDGVVISGGEPTVHEDLEDFIRKIKELGFLVKLDTNGSNPDALRVLIGHELLDYVAMDIKQTKEGYKDLVKNDCQEKIQESIDLIKNSGVEYEFRSTILPYFHSKKDIEAMGKMIAGADRWYLQSFRPIKTLDKKLQRERAFTREELASLKKIAQKYAHEVELR